MDIIEYFEDYPRQRQWMNRIEACDWNAAKYLADLLRGNRFEETLGEDGKLYIMIDETQIVSFVTLTRQDCIADDDLYPWLGFLFTVPQYRGHRYSQKIIEHACQTAEIRGNETIYLATNHIGLYEKYGFIYKENRLDIQGENSRIYYKPLINEGRRNLYGL